MSHNCWTPIHTKSVTSFMNAPLSDIRCTVISSNWYVIYAVLIIEEKIQYSGTLPSKIS